MDNAIIVKSPPAPVAKMDASRTAAIEALQALAYDTEAERDDRCAALKTLGRLANLSEVREALVALANADTDEQDVSIKLCAIETLLQLGARTSGATYLDTIEWTTEDLIEKLLDIAYHHSEAWSVVERLVSSGDTDPQLLKSLIEVGASSDDYDLIRAILDGAASRGKGDRGLEGMVIIRLLCETNACIEADSRFWHRFVEWIPYTDVANHSLVEMLADTRLPAPLRRYVAKETKDRAEAGRFLPEATQLEALWAALHSSKTTSSLRYHVAGTLMCVGNMDAQTAEGVVRSLLTWMCDHFSTMCQISTMCQSECYRTIQSYECYRSVSPCDEALWMLRRAGNISDEMAGLLMSILAGDLCDHLVREVAAALAEFRPTSEELVQSLLKRTLDIQLSYKVRVRALKVLGDMAAQGNTQAKEAAYVAYRAQNVSGKLRVTADKIWREIGDGQ